MAVFLAGIATDLSDVPVVPALSRQAGGREAPRGKSFRPPPENDRSSGAGHRGQGSNHRRPSATRSHLCHGTGAGVGPERGRDRSPARSFGTPRHWKARCSRTHYFEARKAHAGRIREDEDPSHRGRGDSRTSRLSISSRADRSCASREMGWQRLSQRVERRRYSHRRHAFSPRSTASTRWLRTGNTARPCRSTKLWPK